jgi:hypothetical protein
MTTRHADRVEPKVGKAPARRKGSSRRDAGEMIPSPFEEMEKLSEGFFPRG